MLSLILPTLCLLSLAQAPTSTGEELVREGEHFRLVCHFSSASAADQALAAVEFAWDASAELYGLKSSAKFKGMEVHLYPDAESYRAADQKLTGGQFQRNQAFAHFASRTAHVALQPPLSDAALKAMGLPAQTLRLLAHEAAHLVRYAHMRNFADHPGWLSDGAASWVDEQALRKLGLCKQMEQHPSFSKSILRVQELLDGGMLPSVEAVFLDRTKGLDFFQRYNVRWLFFHFMMEGKHRAEFRKAVAQARSIGGGRDFTQRYFKSISKIWNEKEMKKLDKEFQAFIQGLEPEWDEVFRALFLSGDVWAQAAFDSNAIAWRREASGQEYVVEGKLTILPGKKQQMNLFLGRSQKGFFSIAFSAKRGVTVFEYESQTSSWNNRAFFPLEALPLGEPFSFAMAIHGDEVNVTVAGELLGSVKAKVIPLSGPWGLSAQANSAGLWAMLQAPGM